MTCADCFDYNDAHNFRFTKVAPVYVGGRKIEAMDGKADEQKPDPGLAVEQELRQMNDDWVEAFVKRDTATLAELMADDFVFISPLDGDGKLQFLGDLESGDLT